MSNDLRLYGPRTAYVTRQEQYLRGGGSFVPNPDFAIRKDPEFWVKLDGNATIRGASDYRRHLVAAPEIKLTPPSPRDAPLVPVVRALLAQCANLQSAVFGLADAFRRGMTVGRMFGDWEEDLDLLGDDTPRRWFVVRRIDVHDKDRWQLQRIVDGREVRYRWAVWDYDLYGPTMGGWRFPEEEDWYLFHRYQDTAEQLHGRDLARALYYEAYALHILSEASLDTAERFGAPWIYAKVDRQAAGYNSAGGQQGSWSGIARELGNVIATLRAKNYLIGDSRLDMQLLDANLTGASYVRELIKDRKDDCRILLLGSNLPTSATTGGSYALADVQDGVTRRFVSFDRRLMNGTLSDQLIARLVEWNAPTLALMPTNDGTNRSLADCAAPKAELQDDIVLTPQDRQAQIGMAQTAKLRVLRSELHKIAGFEEPPADADPATIVDFGAAPAGGGGTLFAERPKRRRLKEAAKLMVVPGHSPVWLKYAEGRMTA